MSKNRAGYNQLASVPAYLWEVPKDYSHKTKEELVAENQQLSAALSQVQAELAELKRLVFGRKSERFIADEPPAQQLGLFVQHDHEGAGEKTVLQAVQGHSRIKARPKRIKLPDDLPVVAIRIEPHPDEIKGWAKIGEEVTDELDSAVESFQKIGPASPLFVDSSIQIAKILNLQAQYKNSIKDKSGQKKFVAFVNKVKGSSQELHLELAVQLASYFESQLETKSAIKTMEEVMDFKGFVDSHIFYLAALYDKEKNYVNADRMILRILKKDPENAHALNFLGYSLLERNEDMVKAFEYISKAVKLKPQDGYIRDSLGWYYYKNGQLKKALVEIKKAWELVQTDVVITKHLAIIHKDLNNFEEAKKYYFKALAQCKNESERQEVIGDLQDLEGVRLPAYSKEKFMLPSF